MEGTEESPKKKKSSSKKSTTKKSKKSKTKEKESETFDNDAVKPVLEKRKEEVVKVPGLAEDLIIMQAPTYPNSIALSTSNILASISGSILSFTVHNLLNHSNISRMSPNHCSARLFLQQNVGNRH
jgi:hypothetical protein